MFLLCKSYLLVYVILNYAIVHIITLKGVYMLRIKCEKVNATDKSGNVLKDDKGNVINYKHYYLYDSALPKIRVQINPTFCKGENAKFEWIKFNNLIASQEIEND